MQDTLTSKSCSDLVSLFASESPVPGGGGAAALTGALGAALCSMVVNLTIGRKKYAAFEKDLERIKRKASSLEEKLLLLVDKDAEAFEPLSEAYAIPKAEPGRDKLIESAALSACETPLEMMKTICSAIELTEELLDKGNVMLVSDVGCGASLLAAALESASMNIFVNTRILMNKETAGKLDAAADSMINEYLPRAENVVNTVNLRLKGKE